MSRLSGNSRKNLPETGQMNVVRQVARMVSVAANHGPYYANCLKRSVLIWWLLERKGIHTEIRVGAQMDSFGKVFYVDNSGDHNSGQCKNY